MSVRHWLVQLAIAVDQLANVLITPFNAGAWADETMSSRAYRMWRDRRPWGRVLMPLIDTLFFWQPDHCANSYRSERKRLELPPEMRTLPNDA